MPDPGGGGGRRAPDRLESYQMLLEETEAEPEEWE
jgi:hypothetical protein